MLRRLFTLAAVLSALHCATTVSLWVLAARNRPVEFLKLPSNSEFNRHPKRSYALHSSQSIEFECLDPLDPPIQGPPKHTFRHVGNAVFGWTEQVPNPAAMRFWISYSRDRQLWTFWRLSCSEHFVVNEVGGSGKTAT